MAGFFGLQATDWQVVRARRVGTKGVLRRLEGGAGGVLRKRCELGDEGMRWRSPGM